MIGVKTVINGMTFKERKDGRLEGRITVNGNRKSFYGHTKADIKQQAKEYLQKIENGFKEPQKIKLNEYIEYWLINYKLTKIDAPSYTRLYSVYKNQISNKIGERMIGSITKKDIQKLIDDYANPKNKNTKPLALSGIKKIVHLLKPCLDVAVEEGIISANPCENIVLPNPNCVQVQTKNQRSLNDDEIEQFKQVATSKYHSTGEYISRDAFVLLLMLNLGLRVGEMVALEWHDVDIENRIIHINKTIQSNIKDMNSGERYSKLKYATKTKAGIRVLPINNNTLQYLNMLKNYDIRKGIKSEYVACTLSGTRKTPRNLQRSLDRILEKTDINWNVTLHTLRHTFGSTLVRRGIGIEMVSELMGHSNINITYSKYIHAIQAEKAKAMNLVEVC